MFKNTPKGVATRQKLFDTSLALFRTKGFEATTMRDVATAAGVSLGAAYHYFEGKDAIVAEYYDQVQRLHADRVRASMARTRGLAERLKLALHAKLDILGADRPLLGALLRYTGEPAHPLSFLGRGTRDLQLRSMAVFADAIGDEPMPEDVRALAPLLLWAMHMGMLLYFLYDESPQQRRTRALVDRGVDLFVGSLRLAKLPPLRPLRARVRAMLDDARLVPSPAEIARFRAPAHPHPHPR
jgi:AcrR family transcriptional regulator